VDVGGNPEIPARRRGDALDINVGAGTRPSYTARSGVARGPASHGRGVRSRERYLA